MPRRLRSASLALALVLVACAREPAPITVAADVGETLARPLLHEFAERDHATVDRTLEADAELVWARDPARVLQRAAAGELAPLPAAALRGRRPPLVDPGRRWAATAAVGRVIVYDPAHLTDAEAPSRVRDLARPELARRLVLADPSRGSGLWQAAALDALSGEASGSGFFRGLRAAGARVVADEDAAVALLTPGERPLALLDSDRAYAAQAVVPRLVITIPDQGEGDSGVFVLPSVVAIPTRGAANPLAGALAEFLLAPPQAFRIALSSNAFVVVSNGTAPPGLLNVDALKLMPVDYAALVDRLPAVRAAVRDAH
jgi:ABC-type Fe3+ transport system substrate-binding protein